MKFTKEYIESSSLDSFIKKVQKNNKITKVKLKSIYSSFVKKDLNREQLKKKYDLISLVYGIEEANRFLEKQAR